MPNTAPPGSWPPHSSPGAVPPPHSPCTAPQHPQLLQQSPAPNKAFQPAAPGS